MPDIARMIREIALMAVPLLAALTFHEVAHGYAAYLLGDPTAKNAGRLSLNPLKHLDVIGTLAFILTRMIGWAKPVPIDARYFKNPRQGMMLVSLAGPGANFVLAVVFMLVYRLLESMLTGSMSGATASVLTPLAYMAGMGVWVNVALGVFNLVPIPPLDGSNILAGFLPPRLAVKYMAFGRWGIIVIILLAVLRVFEMTIFPLVQAISLFLLS